MASGDPNCLAQKPQEQRNFKREYGAKPGAIHRESKYGDSCPIVLQVCHCNQSKKNRVRFLCDQTHKQDGI